MSCKHTKGARTGQKTHFVRNKLLFLLKSGGRTRLCSLYSVIAKKFIHNDLILEQAELSYFISSSDQELGTMFIIITYIKDMHNLNIQDMNGN